MPGTDIVGPATQASGDLVDQVEPLPTFNGVAGSAGACGHSGKMKQCKASRASLG